MIEEVFILPPEMIAIIILGFIAGFQTIIIVQVRNTLIDYSKMLVMKGRIMADGQITLDDADILQFVKSTIDLMTELEGILHYFTGYILNSPSTGWFKAYVSDVEKVMDAAVQQLAAQEPTVEQPAQPVIPAPGV